MGVQKRETCGGIIYAKFGEDYKLLCVKQRSSQKWGPPKGGLEGWETELECAQREIKEETGLIINKNEIKRKTSIMRSTYFIIPIFRYIPPFFRQYDTREIEKVAWIPFEDIPLYETNRHLKEIYKMKEIIINNY